MVAIPGASRRQEGFGPQPLELKPPGICVDIMVMRFQQLVLEEGSAEVTLAFHPRLTVVAGLGREEREGVIGEVLGVMAGVRPNGRLDMVDDTGRRLSVRRAATHELDKVINMGNAHEESLEFLNGGRIDVLHSLGLTPEQARRRCRLGPDDISAVGRGETLVASLATRPQRQLWAAAERVRAAGLDLAAETQPAISTAEDRSVLEDIELRHTDCQTAMGRHDTIRQYALFVGGICALAAATTFLINRWTPLPFLAVALLTMLIGIVSRRRMARSRKGENLALAAVGASSYVGFHMQRISERLDRHEETPSLKVAKAELREATAAWLALAGGVSADWAFAMRTRIGSAAERLASGTRVRSHFSAAGPGQPSPAELAEALMIRLADLRHVGPDGESFPLILDEPLVGIDLPVKQWMLELVARTAGSPQVVYLTDDPDIAAWARIEAPAGHLDVIEPIAPAITVPADETVS